MFLLAETRKEHALVFQTFTKDVEDGAAKKAWEIPMYDPGGCMIMRYFKRLNKPYFFKEFILSQSV